MDSVFINQLKVETLIGLYPWELQVRQPLLISLDMQWDNRRAGQTGALEHGLDYAAVVARVERFAAEHQHQLLEAFAEELAAILIAEFTIPALTLRLAKTTTIPQAHQVGISIERSAADYGG